MDEEVPDSVYHSHHGIHACSIQWRWPRPALNKLCRKEIPLDKAHKVGNVHAMNKEIWDVPSTLGYDFVAFSLPTGIHIGQ